MQKDLIKALRKVLAEEKPLGKNFLKSGNLTNKLKKIDIEQVLELSDANYNRTTREKTSSEEGYILGRLNRTKKPVYRIEIPPYILFFIGTEADILRKIAKLDVVTDDKNQGSKQGSREKTDDGTDKEMRKLDEALQEL